MPSSDRGTDMTPPPTTDEQQVLNEVLVALRSLQHGSIQLVVQDAKVVQIDTLAKRRLDRGGRGVPHG
jgi:hypothetical protein